MVGRVWPKWAWFCSRCGVKNAPRVPDCTACRQAYLGAPPATAGAAICPKCQERSGTGTLHYCESCGAHLPATGVRKTIAPATTGPVEGLYMGRDVLLNDIDKRERGGLR